MPELPEVETIRKILEPIVKGNKILSIDVLRSSNIVLNPKEFTTTLAGKTFESISRIGKFLIFHLSDEVVLLSHLRMEGKYYDYLEGEKNSEFARVVFHLSNGHKLVYDDSRCFGILRTTTEKEYKNVKDIAQLGPEPFYVDDVNYLIEKTYKSNHTIKETLLDQTLMCGIGNIYADEILFACKIHPLTPAKLIKKEEWIAIIENAKRILNFAIEQGGSTIRSYHPGKDMDGSFQRKLLAYGRENQPCINCGHPLRFMKVGGRGTTYCPICQVKKGAPIKVAIFGKISSGKSTVLNLFKEAGYPVASCDEIVKEVYDRPEVIKKINNSFNIPGDSINRDILRKLILVPSNKKKLESIVHPIVIDEVNKFIKSKNSEINITEVPLLYEAKMDDMFDVIIAVDIDSELQKERLEKRNGKAAKELSVINNMNAKFDENKKKADFVINNNSDLNSLYKQVSDIISKLINRLS